VRVIKKNSDFVAFLLFKVGRASLVSEEMIHKMG
jgi:hypothetical protein